MLEIMIGFIILMMIWISMWAWEKYDKFSDICFFLLAFAVVVFMSKLIGRMFMILIGVVN
ncbi:MAG: hypothetical protein ACRDDY_07860 [Clostridium sp.]|uniref:hypothetical protein n=1 Tax=Clostridium sp. TaxID=1506 RepID=UPI003EE57768